MRKNNLQRALDVIKRFWKPFLIVFSIYCFSMLALWRANVSFIDDVGRAPIGYGWTSDFNRYSSSFLSFFLINMNLKLADLSPYTQILAMAFLAISSIIITYVLCEKKIKTVPLILTTLFGLTPMAITCWSYKFDAPCMALAVLASVMPFIFWPSEKASKKSWIKFLTISLLCLIIMWTSYQAFSGVYVVMVIAIVIRDLLNSNKFKETLLRALICVVPYLLATIIFKFCFPEVHGYRPTEMFAISELIPGIFHNLALFGDALCSWFTVIWKVAILGLFIATLASFYIFSKKTKVAKLVDVFIGACGVLLCVVFSFGAYLVLDGPEVLPRALVGFGISLAIMGVFATRNLTVKNPKILLAAPGLLLLYLFIVFSFAYSNALADQQRYGDFRNDLMVSDLSHLYSNHEELASKKLQIQGQIGLSAVAQHVANEYPVTNLMIDIAQQGLSEHVWGTKRFQFNYNIGVENFPDNNGRLDCSTMPVKLDTYYHEIRAEGEYICVILK